MPTPVSTAKQCLTEEAARALGDAVAVARRRSHAQTTSLHAVSALLALPSAILRDACARARSCAYSPRLQFRALELSVSVSLDRLPTVKTLDEPPISNSLMAAIKRSQANQRRHPDTFHIYQQLQHFQFLPFGISVCEKTMKMEDLDPTACFMVDDDLLNFSLEDETVEEDDEKSTITSKDPLSYSSSSSTNPLVSLLPHPECVEEELEWLSNKDAFPAIEFGILSENPGMVFDHHSPVSVLENSSSTSHSSGNGVVSGNAYTSCCVNLKVPVNYPVRARSKRRRRRRRGGFAGMPSEHCLPVTQQSFKSVKQREPLLSLPMNSAKSAASIGRRCQHCGADKTPQWRAGPLGPKTLCNACGVRYKSGRLLPEYRPANSPTFSAAAHSNSHRKVLEMRKHKIGVGGMLIHEACGYRVGQ